MTAPKDSVTFSKKRACGNASVSESTSDTSSPKRRKRDKKSGNKATEDPHEEASTAKTDTLIGHSTITSPHNQAIVFDWPSRPALETRQPRDGHEGQAVMRLEKMQSAVRTLLECIGEDVDREGLQDTPLRYAKALLFLTKGYQMSVEDTVNNALFCEGHSQMVIVKDIEIFSLCEHHLVPFTGKIHIGYIPSNTVIGLSKLSRIAEIFSRRLQIQERLTKEVAHAITDVLKPQGVAVVMESSHLCMVIRGVEKTSAKTLTSCMLGCFETKSETRYEFLRLVGMNG
ncbi:GTP cyclohydrolase 1 [Fusarium sp. LHS14.1]|nr:GTP cyclohydrolase 1 [Fusarium sp. LHS14.1]